MPETTTIANKVRFNIKNCHYSILTDGTSPSFGTPVAIPGAVSIDLSPAGDETVFYADGIKYWIGNANSGYTGSLNVALIPEAMLKDVWGQTQDTTSKNLLETVDDVQKDFALGFQVDGDDHSEYVWFFRCTAKRPNIAANTNTDTKNPDTQSIDLTIAPMQNGHVKIASTKDTSSTVIEGWFSAVVQS